QSIGSPRSTSSRSKNDNRWATIRSARSRSLVRHSVAGSSGARSRQSPSATGHHRGAPAIAAWVPIVWGYSLSRTRYGSNASRIPDLTRQPISEADIALSLRAYHAIVGLATAVQFEPAARRDGRPLAPLAIAGWAPAVVALSYLPDVVTQVGSTAGWTHAGLFGHSAAVAVAGGALVGALWARASGISARRLVTISIGAMLGHDLLDLLQSTDRAPFWPWWNRIITTGASLLPTGIA